MGQAVFQVVVPFGPAAIQSLLSTSTTYSVVTDLPEYCDDVDCMTVCRTNEGYQAIVRVQARDRYVAKKKAVLEVQDLLRTLALGDDGFEVNLSSVTVRQGGLRDGTKEVLIAPDSLSVATIGIGKRKENLSFEAKTLSSRSCWNDSLRHAIELNYLGVVAGDFDVSFLLLMTALDLLTSKKIGNPPALLKERLGDRYKEFKKAFRTLLDEWNLAESDAGRLSERLFQTYQFSATEQIVKYLEDLGIDKYSQTKVQRWWRIRGQLAHGFEVDVKEFGSAYAQLRAALHAALRREVTRCHE